MSATLVPEEPNVEPKPPVLTKENVWAKFIGAIILPLVVGVLGGSVGTMVTVGRLLERVDTNTRDIQAVKDAAAKEVAAIKLEFTEYVTSERKAKDILTSEAKKQSGSLNGILAELRKSRK